MSRAARIVVPVVVFGALSGASWLTSGSALGQDVSPAPETGTGATGPLETEEPRDQIVLSGDVLVRRGEAVGEVVVLHGTVVVAGIVRGDVVVIDGRIDVTGQVSGSVVSINGPVTIGRDAQVLGDVLARDRVQIEQGARIEGDVRQGAAFTFRTPIDVFGRFAAWLAVAISTLALGLLLLLVAPLGADAVSRAAASAPWASLGCGAAAFVGLPVIGVLSLVTLIGLPFGIALLLALFLIYSVGFAWSAFVLGRLLWSEPRRRVVALLIGWAIVSGASAIPYVGGFVWFGGAVFGLGVTTVAVWRARGAGGRHRPGGKMLEPVGAADRGGAWT